MSKNIIFCADGTWNGPGEPDSDDKMAPDTNVFKLFLDLDGKDDPGTTKLEKEQERSLKADDGSVLQVAKYLHGVGDSQNFLVRVLGGTLGAGLITRIVRGYTFVSRNYRPGDKIFLVGFSRGAYTARALAGLITAKGLLDANKLNLDDKETAYRLGVAVWFAGRKAALHGDQGLLSNLFDTVLDFPIFLMHPPSEDQLVPAPIEAVAVWDTVGALGIPVYNEHLVRLDVFRFADTKLSDNPDPAGCAHQPWAHLPFSKLFHGPRALPKGLCLSQSVLDRVGAVGVMAAPGLKAAACAPGNLRDYLAGKAAAAGIKIV